jgi:hypothetical protein
MLSVNNITKPRTRKNDAQARVVVLYYHLLYVVSQPVVSHLHSLCYIIISLYVIIIEQLNNSQEQVGSNIVAYP